MHFPTLTVGQTLNFALSLKTPGKRLPTQTLKQFREEVMNLLLRMVNIPHTKNTLVGNAEVRGISGGERKRVSILEMMTARPAVRISPSPASWETVADTPTSCRSLLGTTVPRVLTHPLLS
jgi:ABC-type multidrug transport system ATPase subunit